MVNNCGIHNLIEFDLKKFENLIYKIIPIVKMEETIRNIIKCLHTLKIFTKFLIKSTIYLKKCSNPIVAPNWIKLITISLKMFGGRKRGLICCQQARNLSLISSLEHSTEYSSSRSFIWNEHQQFYNNKNLPIFLQIFSNQYED